MPRIGAESGLCVGGLAPPRLRPLGGGGATFYESPKVRSSPYPSNSAPIRPSLAVLPYANGPLCVHRCHRERREGRHRRPLDGLDGHDGRRRL